MFMMMNHLVSIGGMPNMMPPINKDCDFGMVFECLPFDFSGIMDDYGDPKRYSWDIHGYILRQFKIAMENHRLFLLEKINYKRQFSIAMLKLPRGLRHH